jgi:hypothetical protein
MQPTTSLEFTSPLPNLAKALIKFQSSVPTIHDNAESFHGGFANLPGVLSKIGPALRAAGLVVSQLPEEINGQPGLRTTLMHTSGEHVSAVTPLAINSGKNGTQEWGKSVTYQRRFCLLSVLGLCVGIEDNDADIAEKAPAKPAAKIEGVADNDQPLSKGDRELCLGLIQELSAENLARFCKDFRRDFGLASDAKIAPVLTGVKHQNWMNENLKNYV